MGMDKMTPPVAMINALKKGLKLHEMGLSGKGLQPDTVMWAKRFVAGDDASPEKILKAARWWGRNERFLKEPDKSPAMVAALLWGGAAGRDWFRSKYKELTHEKDEEKMGYKEEEDDS
jgi:hypothetical protein